MKDGDLGFKDITVKGEARFEVRHDASDPLRVGQIVFDPNGEYANVNVQDQTAVKNVWRANAHFWVGKMAMAVAGVPRR